MGRALTWDNILSKFTNFTLHSIKWFAITSGSIVTLSCTLEGVLSLLFGLLRVGENSYLAYVRLQSVLAPRAKLDYYAYFEMITHSMCLAELVLVLLRMRGSKRIMEQQAAMMNNHLPIDKSLFLFWIILLANMYHMSTTYFPSIRIYLKRTPIPYARIAYVVLHMRRTFQFLASRTFLVSTSLLYERELRAIAERLKSGLHEEAMEQYRTLSEEYHHVADSFSPQILVIMLYEVIYLVRMITGHVWTHIRSAFLVMLSWSRFAPILSGTSPTLLRTVWVLFAPQLVLWQREEIRRELLRLKLQYAVRREPKDEGRKKLLPNGNESSYDIYEIWIEQFSRDNMDLSAFGLMNLNLSLLCTLVEMTVSYIVISIGFVA